MAVAIRSGGRWGWVPDRGAFMRGNQRIAVVVCLVGGMLSGFARAAAAQSPLPSRSVAAVVPAPNAVSPVERAWALERWTKDYAAWKAWFDQWRNRPEPGLWHNKDRRDPPVPPDWLAADCARPAENEGMLAEACQFLADSTSADLATEMVVAQQTTARTQKEAPGRTAWWSHVHLDALWPMTQGGSSVFGVVGLHTTIGIGGRMQIFLAPGAILLRAPSLDGSQHWQPATDWGFSYRMFNFTMPGIRR